MFVTNRVWAVWLALLAAAAFPTVGAGVVYDFQAITNNNPDDVATGEGQLSMDVTAPAANQVQFTFYNTGAGSCVITRIYFEHGLLGDIAMISGSSGVSFQEGGTPKSVPAGNSLTPRFGTAFRISADNPSPHNGVANGQSPDQDWISVVFNLAPGKTLDDVLAQLDTGALRVGVHVQSFSSGGSESFINAIAEWWPE